MNIQKLMNKEIGRDEFEQSLLDLDSEFRFKCRRCGKCCKHQDTILFNSRDIFNIAKKLGKTTEEVVKECAEVYIGKSSRIPVVHMVPVGPRRLCPLLLEDGRCSVHDCKPTVCALYPVGRVAAFGDIGPGEEITREKFEVRYILNDIDCGSAKRVNTIRDWLARFGIPEKDEFFLRWTEVTAQMGQMVRSLEARNCSEEFMNFIWGNIFGLLYMDYDTQQEFMPQFEENVSKLRRSYEVIKQVGDFFDGKGDLPAEMMELITSKKGNANV